MTREPLQQAAEAIRRLAAAQECLTFSDEVLLKRFLALRDEAAFEALVRRYGPMILGVCRRMLHNRADMDDVFQAVFLVLLRKGATIKQPHLLGNWLYGVAFQTARAERNAIQKRRAKESQVKRMPLDATADRDGELMAILDEELARLPEIFRAAIVLCDLQEASRKVAAQKLAISEGTLSSRLSRGRAMLAARLRRRGVEAPFVALTSGMGSALESLEVPAALVHGTVQSILGKSIPSTVAFCAPSAKAIQLSETVIKIMLLNKLKVLLPVAFVVVLGMGLGVRALAMHGQPAEIFEREAPLQAQATTGEDVEKLMKQSLGLASTIEDEEIRLNILVKLAHIQLRRGNRAEALALANKAFAISKTMGGDRRKASIQSEIASIQLEAQDKEACAATLQAAEKSVLAIENAPERRNAILDLIRILCSMPNFDQAFQLAGQAEEFHSTALGEIAASVAQRGDTSQTAIDAVLRARTEAIGLTPAGLGGSAYVQPICVIAGALARMGKLDEAMQTVKLLSEKDGQSGKGAITPSFVGFANNEILRGQAESGDWKRAIETYKSIPNDTRKFGLLAQIASAQIRSGHLDEAKKTLLQLRGMADDPGKLPGGQPKGLGRGRGNVQPRYRSGQKEQILSRVAILEAEMGRFEEAQKTAAELPHGVERARAWLAIGKAQCKAGDKLNGKKSLRQASRSVGSASEMAQSMGLRDSQVGNIVEEIQSQLLGDIAREQAHVGDLEEANVTLEDIASDDRKNSPSILIATAQGGNLDDARQMLPRIKKRVEKARALEGLARAMTKAGGEQGALALMNEQTSPALKAYTLIGILDAKTPEAKPE